jgi:predicted transcriptional regulator
MPSTRFLNGISIPGVGTVSNSITLTGTVTAGSSTIYTTGTNGTVNTDPAITIKQTNPPELEVKGRMVINGIDLEERLSTIEKVLQIPERDVKLEAKYPSLKKKYDEYIKDLSKYRMWEAIKGEDND